MENAYSIYILKKHKTSGQFNLKNYLGEADANLHPLSIDEVQG